MRWYFPAWFFKPDEKRQIVEAIQQAEAQTSGEIRVHLLRSFPKHANPLPLAAEIFEKLGMTQTQEHNGILFLLELKHRRLILLGDRGIHEKVSPDFWKLIHQQILQYFRQGQFTQGLVEGILTCGEQLREFFPRRESDLNELNDKISHGKLF